MIHEIIAPIRRLTMVFIIEICMNDKISFSFREKFNGDFEVFVLLKKKISMC